MIQAYYIKYAYPCSLRINFAHAGAQSHRAQINHLITVLTYPI